MRTTLSVREPLQFGWRCPWVCLRGAALSCVVFLCAGLASQSDASDDPVSRPQKPPAIPLDPEAEPLKIAFISYANPQQVIEDIKPVVAYLERYVGVPVKGFVTLDYVSSV